MFTPLSFASIRDSWGLNNLQMLGIIAAAFIVLAIAGALLKISDKKLLRFIGHICHTIVAAVILLILIPKRFLAMAFLHGIKGVLILAAAIVAIAIIVMWMGEYSGTASTPKKKQTTKPKQASRPRYMVADRTFTDWGAAWNYSQYVKKNNLGPSNIVEL